MLGMNESELQGFVERIAATAIANQAVLKCHLRGVPVTIDNVILFVGDFIEPERPEFANLIGAIETAIEQIVEIPWPLSGSQSDDN